MWPWEHVAFGYLLYSLREHLWNRRRPADHHVVALGVGSVFPDLVDKPLSWSLGLLPTGLSFAHSLLFATPGLVAVFLLARNRGDATAGVAFGVGYLSHLAGDALYPLFTGGRVGYRFLVWPVYGSGPPVEPGLVSRVSFHLSDFGTFLGTPLGRLYLLAEVVSLSAAFLLWAWDGFPGPGVLVGRSAEEAEEPGD